MIDPRATGETSVSGLSTSPVFAIQRLAAFGIIIQPNGRGEALGTVANAREVLERHPRFAGRFWLDTFHQEILTTWDGNEPRRWADVDRIAIADVLQGEMGLFRFTPELVEQAVTVIAMKNQRDELSDWLKSLRWDEVPRLDAWLANTAGVPQDEYHTAVARNFIISMVARGLAPGCKVDTMPVFEGSQGKGKSTLLSVLGGQFYAELTDSLDSKDFFVSIQGKWLVEIAELDAFRKSDVTRIKQVLSSQVDRFRPPYGKHSIDSPRRAVFAGTTNESDYLRDATGARRFWPALVGDINLDWLRQNREQIFAEAVEQYQGHATWWEIPEQAHREHTDARREDDVWEASIADYCLGRTEVSIPDVLHLAVGVDLAKQGKAEQVRAGRALKSLGYERKTVKRAGKAVKRWIKGEPEPDALF
ncbi:virulence-associated E family protein [Burkholderia pseudomallei]|uniref:virulence-associated E family protein n=1 Tax=Burkholderia pseudomallei TaxID=28450 RepID=UPI00053112C9|nr:virulence-associated E family protein [Burkholderia pseudomallei]KGS21601.1 virulence-associated E family protein [Burkholderia pseudomallei MSHR5569]